VAVTLNLNNVRLPPRDEVQHDLAIAVEPGTVFIREGTLVEVIGVNGNDVVVLEDDTLNQYVIDINEAAQLISNYLE
jgi:hypothetical protein